MTFDSTPDGRVIAACGVDANRKENRVVNSENGFDGRA
jgi:hypothetical protein